MMWPLPDDGSFSDGWRRRPATDDPDIRLTCRVAEALLSDGRTRDQRITVKVQNRVVLLGGTVDTESAKLTVRDIARDVAGVADICDSLRVTGEAGERQPSGDDDRFQEIVADLRADAPRVRDPLLLRGPRFVMWVFSAAVVWALLTVLMVTARWDAVAAICLAIGVMLAMVQLRRKRSARRGG